MASTLPGPTHIQARDGAVLVGRGLAYWGDVRLEVLQGVDDVPINCVTGKPTFTLVALHIPGKDLPDVTRWKLG